MLSELKHVRQIEGEGTRRWFRDSCFDLTVWYDEGGALTGFQLCYDRLGSPTLTDSRRRGRRDNSALSALTQLVQHIPLTK